MSALRTEEPDEVVFEYQDHLVVPVAAYYYATGAPYTGRGHGSNGVADWLGPFENGLPHGEFQIVWGDRMSGSAWFAHGAKVEDIDEGKRGRGDEV